MSDCGVCISFSEGERAETFVESFPVARKPHQCSECGRVIQPHTKYQRVFMVSGGAPDTFKTCAVCAEIRETFCCGGAMYGGIFWDDAQDYIFPELTTGCLDRLKTPEAKRYLLERWNEWKFAQ